MATAPCPAHDVCLLYTTLSPLYPFISQLSHWSLATFSRILLFFHRTFSCPLERALYCIMCNCTVRITPPFVTLLFVCAPPTIGVSVFIVQRILCSTCHLFPLTEIRMLPAWPRSFGLRHVPSLPWLIIPAYYIYVGSPITVFLTLRENTAPKVYPQGSRRICAAPFHNFIFCLVVTNQRGDFQTSLAGLLSQFVLVPAPGSCLL